MLNERLCVDLKIIQWKQKSPEAGILEIRLAGKYNSLAGLNIY